MVRLSILATSDRMEPCLDEVEVYSVPKGGDAMPRNVALASAGGMATASSEYANAPIHKIAHLNDGLTGNSHSWISKTPGKGSITLSWPEAGNDRPRRLGTGSGGGVSRQAGNRVFRGGREAGHWQVIASSLDRGPYDPQTATASSVTASGLNQGISRGASS